MKRRDLLTKLREEKFNLEMNMLSPEVIMTDEQYDKQKSRLAYIKNRIEVLDRGNKDEEIDG